SAMRRVEYQPHGIIPLSTIIDCLQTDPVSKSKQYCLRIVTAKRSFVCCAPDEDTLLQWLDALHVECDRVALEARQEAAEQAASPTSAGTGTGAGDAAGGLTRVDRPGPVSPTASVPVHNSSSTMTTTTNQIRKVMSLESGVGPGSHVGGGGDGFQVQSVPATPMPVA
ncbi:hypothetical protein BGZ97_002444, partial [Linnemannia gamsii]